MARTRSFGTRPPRGRCSLPRLVPYTQTGKSWTYNSCPETLVYRRSKDVGTPVGEWFAELIREDAWFSKVVPNVRINRHFQKLLMTDTRTSSRFCLSKVCQKASMAVHPSHQFVSTQQFTCHGWPRNASRTGLSSNVALQSTSQTRHTFTTAVQRLI